MSIWQSIYKGRWREFLTSLLFYSGMLELVSRFANCLRFDRDDTDRLVFPFVRRRWNREIQILAYHRVNNDRDPYFSGVLSDVFRKQMAYLASHAYVCSLEEAVERMKKVDIPDNTIVVTFDDGYRDNFVNAFPILQEFSIPATFFLATAAIGSGEILWHDKVFSAFRETRERRLSDYGPHLQNYPLRTVQERLFAQTQTLKFLKSLDGEERSFWISRLRDQLQVVDREEKSDLMLTWDHVRTMHRSGMSFGSHTVTHPILSRLSVEQMKEEICASKGIIEKNLGVSITTFAYPNGRKEDFNEITKKIARESGYTCAVSTIFGTNTVDQDLFELRRGGPSESHLPTFATKLHWYRFHADA